MRTEEALSRFKEIVNKHLDDLRQEYGDDLETSDEDTGERSYSSYIEKSNESKTFGEVIDVLADTAQDVKRVVENLLTACLEDFDPEQHLGDVPLHYRYLSDS